MKKTKVGVLGTGHLGRLHTILYDKVENAELIGIFDVNQNRAFEVAEEAGCTVFSDYQTMLSAVDAVNIVVPTTYHYEAAVEALSAGKHLFIEKPITTTIEQAQSLIALADEKQLLIQVGHIERFNQAMRALSTVKVAPKFIESHRLSTFNPRGTDVAVVLDLMIHDIDIILSLVDSPVQKIDANGVAVISTEVDIANARITFENGCVANVTASRISQKQMRKMRLFERDSYISIDFLQGITERFNLVTDSDISSDSAAMIMGTLAGEKTRHVQYQRLSAPEGNALQMELQTFVDAIQQNSTPKVTALDGSRALKIASQITDIISKNQI
ncbi:MAG: Gfo/Idh/MocA family oxidoreductase [Deferribacteres bacterium]|nr:Gfo/Idh/MocA family oxidoreductase [candidate division KSB1 bacterium]MCB9503044.1 Gfo/Idh/MocA family oxidoreductase [Deferribacteres bacterium]